MTYRTPQALRMALERRLLTRSNQTRVSLDRLRRRVLFERVIARLVAAEPGLWVLKGGMALEVRLRDDARLTKDIDLGLRGEVADAPELHERLIDVLAADPDGDSFALTPGQPKPLRSDTGGHLTWRVKVAAELGGRQFGGIQLDISPREYELSRTDIVNPLGTLDFAGIPAPTVEIVDIHRHAAEKLHAMLREHGDRENSRVRDLVDLAILIEHEMLGSTRLAPAVARVWSERDGTQPPATLPPLPESWPDRYVRLTDNQNLDMPPYAAAVAMVQRLWGEMVHEPHPTERS